MCSAIASSFVPSGFPVAAPWSLEQFHLADGHLLLYQEIPYDEKAAQEERQNVSCLGFSASLKGDTSAYAAPPSAEGFSRIAGCSPAPRQGRVSLRWCRANSALHQQENKDLKAQCLPQSTTPAPLTGSEGRWAPMSSAPLRWGQGCICPNSPLQGTTLGQLWAPRAWPYSCLHTVNPEKLPDPSSWPCLPCKI